MSASIRWLACCGFGLSRTWVFLSARLGARFRKSITSRDRVNVRHHGAWVRRDKDTTCAADRAPVTLQFRLLLCDQGCDLQHAVIPAVLKQQQKLFQARRGFKKKSANHA